MDSVLGGWVVLGRGVHFAWKKKLWRINETQKVWIIHAKVTRRFFWFKYKNYARSALNKLAYMGHTMHLSCYSFSPGGGIFKANEVNCFLHLLGTRAFEFLLLLGGRFSQSNRLLGSGVERRPQQWENCSTSRKLSVAHRQQLAMYA